MVYPYMTLADGTEIVYTNVFEEDGIKKQRFILKDLLKMALIQPDVNCRHILGLYGKASPMKR